RRPVVERGFRLMWSYAGDGARSEMGSLDLPAEPGAYATVGRHTCADVVLARDEQISLRHLLATAYVLEDGGVALRLLDLQTTLPMCFDDDVPRHSLVASSPFRVRLGRYVLAGAPIVAGAPVAEPLHPPAPAAAVSVRELPLPPRTTLFEDAPSQGDGRVSSVASLPPVASVVMLVSSKSESELSLRSSVRHSPKLRAGEAHLGFEHAGRRRGVVFDVEELDRGLLVGRDPRCVGAGEGGGVGELLPIQVSRVHVLLLRDHGRIFAFDTGSTNGTFRRGERLRRAELDADHPSLRLGGRDGVKMTLTVA
ncbi:MAG TPA: FHA domain-containing protein, partial [Polyangiaceae bacterium]|nr:FHA domain-containing protein [Polyangiaceae bacterium]